MLQSQIFRSYRKHRLYINYVSFYETNFFWRMIKTLLVITILILVHSLGMMAFEGMTFNDAIWLSLTTVTTVGYGDFSASTWPGRVITVVLLFIIGIALLAQLAAEFFDYRMLTRTKKIKGLWRWKNMKDHLLIVNTPNDNTESYLIKLIQQIRQTPSLETIPIQILTSKYAEGLPESITSLGIVHYHGVAENDENLRGVNIGHAKYIILLAKDPNDRVSDSLTFDVLSRIQALGTQATIAVEVAQDTNRERMKNLGVEIVIRPIRAYPELLVRALVATGTEQVLENLFIYDGDHMARFDCAFSDKKWSDIVCRFVVAGAGIPMGYINETGVHVNPLPSETCSGSSIISLIKSSQNISIQDAKKCLM